MEIEANKFSQEQLEEFQQAFNLFDTDCSGTISKDELRAVMKSLGQNPSDRELQETMAVVDADGNGSIDFPEFLAVMAKSSKEDDCDDEVKEAFMVFDKDGDGYITTSELKQVMENIGEKLTDSEIEGMLKEADVDGDGKISFDEFVRMMMGK